MKLIDPYNQEEIVDIFALVEQCEEHGECNELEYYLNQ
jgi:hypothetical protein